MPAAVLAWVGAAVLIGVEAGPVQPIVAALLWGGAAFALVLGVRVPLFAAVSIALTAAALVASVVAVQAPARAPEVFAEAAGRSAVQLEVTVTTMPRDGRMAGRAVVSEARSGGTASVLLFADEQPASPPRIGETWRVTARLVATEPADDVAFLAFAEGGMQQIGRAPPLLGAASALRAGLVAATEGLPGDGAGLLPGLAVGDTSGVSAGLDDAMKAASLSHLTAVSGANCALVTGGVFAMCALLGFSRAWRVGCALVALLGFVVLVTPEPSVLRAAVMGGIVLLALAGGRAARGMPALCLAVIVLVIADPWLARSYGFALSVLATAGLLLLAGPLARVLARWMPAPLALVLAVPTAAQLACQPVLLLLSPTLPLWGVPANLLAAPAAPLGTVVGLVACLIAPVSPSLAHGFAAIAWVPSAWIAAVSRTAEALPGARMPWPAGVPGIVLVVVLSGVVLLAALAPPGTRLRRLAAGAACIGVVAVAGTVGGIRVATLVSRPADWQIAMCDVGQGDSTLVRSRGVVALVDTGPDPALLTACLDDLGIAHIDLLVLTHGDLDHVGGIEAVLGRVDTVIVGPADERDQRMRDALRANGARLVQASTGVSGHIGALEWRALWPPARAVEPGNAASIAIALAPGAGCGACLSALLLGDLDESAQRRMRLTAHPPSVDVLKVAHHGSRDFDASLYVEASARVALIGVGVDNDYGHPTDAALESLAASGAAVFRTDRDGLILVSPPVEVGGLPRVWTSRSTRPHPPVAPGR